MIDLVAGDFPLTVLMLGEAGVIGAVQMSTACDLARGWVRQAFERPPLWLYRPLYLGLGHAAQTEVISNSASDMI